MHNPFQFSSIYFRDLKFTQDLEQLVFEDRHEVVFERVKLGENVGKMDILVENINGSMNHVFRIEESEFPGKILLKLLLNPEVKSRSRRIFVSHAT